MNSFKSINGELRVSKQELQEVRSESNLKMNPQEIARKIMGLAVHQKSDESANTLSRIGESLVEIGAPHGPRNLKEVSIRAGVPEETILKAIEYARKF